MKSTILSLVCGAALGTTGCSHSVETGGGQTETGKGTFISENGGIVTAVYSGSVGTKNDGQVKLQLPDRTEVELHQARSGSGIRYTNETAEWWEHQGEATYVVEGTNVFRGKTSSAQ